MGKLWPDALLIAKKELVHLSRDKRSQILTLVLPVVAMAAFSFSFAGQNFKPDGEVNPYPMSVKDLDNSAESRQFLDILQRTNLFTLHILGPSVDAAAYMKENGTFGTLILPDGFSDSFQSGRAEIGFLYDNTKPYVGVLTLQRVKLVIDAIALERGRGVEFTYETLVSTGGSLDIFTPGIVVLLLAFTSLNDMATSITRERSDGTLGRIFIAPTSKAALLIGKIGAGLLLVIGRALLILLLAIFALGVSFRGDLLSYLAIALLVGLATLGLGVLLAARARTDREVMVATLLVIIVLMFMMGAITPVDLMTRAAQIFASFIPHTWATEALRRIMLLGASVLEEGPAVLVLAGSSLLFLVGGAFLFRRTID